MELIGTTLEVAGKVAEAVEKVAKTAEKVAEATEKVIETSDKTAELTVPAVDRVVGRDALTVTNGEMDGLLEKAIGIERAERKSDINFTGVKICATRHGCKGATNCDHAYGGPVGR